jgi:hypothetical protein
VFVHGFTGHPEGTWSYEHQVSDGVYEDSGDSVERPSKFRRLSISVQSSQRGHAVRKHIYWPRDLIPTNIQNARILTYGYDPRICCMPGSTTKKNTMYDTAWNFLVELEAARRLKSSRPLLFIAHSLGGIIVKEALRRSRACKQYQSHLYSIYDFASGIIFFGTPHGGSNPRQLVQYVLEQVIRVDGFKVNEQVAHTFFPSAEQLRKLCVVFGEMAREKEWIIHSFQEQGGDKSTNGQKVRSSTVPRPKY